MWFQRRLVILGCCFVAVGCGMFLPQAKPKEDQDPRRHRETTGGFSYMPPEGWTVREFPGLKYKVVTTTPMDQFAPNLNVVDENWQGTLEEYAKQSLAQMQQLLPGYQLVKREAFQTSGGMAGVKIVQQNQQEGKQLRQVAYLFTNGTRAFVLTGSALTKSGEQFDGAFDGAAKSFRFE